MTEKSISSVAGRERRIVADFPSFSGKRAMSGALFVSGLLTLHAGLSLLGATFGIEGMPLHFSFLGTNIFYGASLLVSGAFATAVAVRQYKRWDVQEREVRETILRAAYRDDPSRSSSK